MDKKKIEKYYHRYFFKCIDKDFTIIGIIINILVFLSFFIMIFTITLNTLIVLLFVMFWSIFAALISILVWKLNDKKEELFKYNLDTLLNLMYSNFKIEDIKPNHQRKGL